MGIFRALAVLSVACLTAIGPSSAQQADARTNSPLARFYDDPRPERLVGFLDGFARNPSDWSAYPPLAGFFAVIFRRHPDSIDKLLPVHFDAKTAETVVAALRLSGQSSIAPNLRSRLMDAGRDPDLQSELAHLPSRPEDLRIVIPTHLDILWGAFFASGDGRYIRMILDFFAQIANRSEDTAIDITKITAAMYTGSKETFAQLRAKYADDILRQLVYASTAQWALVSNAQQHPLARKAVELYIAEHPSSFATLTLGALMKNRN